MLSIILVMLAVLAVAVVVVVYVAYPHRRATLPAAPWLGRAMSRAADRLPTITPEEAEEHRMDLRR